MDTTSSIETSRLVMRAFEMSDVAAALEYQSNPDVVRYIPWPVRDAAMVEESIAKLMTCTTLSAQGDGLSWALVQRSDGRLVGQMNVMYESEKDQCGEIGYVVNPFFAGRGFATEASFALVKALWATGMFRRIIARVDARNLASAAVVRKLGFRQEAHFVEDDFFKGEWSSTLIFATLRAEWESRSSGS